MSDAGSFTKQIVVAGDMSVGFTSETLTVPRNLKLIGLDIEWSTTDGDGTITIEGSSGGEFKALTFDPVLTQPNADDNGFLLQLEKFPWKYFRVKYTKDSDTDGEMNVWVTVKED